ncbi:hypothetical protein IMZ48_38475 [Candidatus Bathyarchaeota archaeon]|nr:hypothetical protein [Candidatus Bathyarchaeota archaeon]
MPAFTLFLNLPPEVQDMIWTAAIPHTPTGHVVMIKRTPLPGAVLYSQSDVSMHRVDDSNNTSRGITTTTMDAVATLSKTCFASRRVAQRALKFIDTEVALIKAPIHADTFTDANTTTDMPEMKINVAADLFILSPTWYRDNEDELTIPVSLDPVRYFAFEYPFTALAGGENGAVAGDRVTQSWLWWITYVPSLARVQKLRVAYILVSPEALAASTVPFPENMNHSILERFVSAYHGDRGTQGPWVCDGHEYREVSTDEVRELGGLHGLIADVESLRSEMRWNGLLDYEAAEVGRGKTSMRLRLMTWRDLDQ